MTHVRYTCPKSRQSTPISIGAATNHRLLAEKGYRLEDMQTLPADLANELMTEACTYASLNLTKIEARSLFRSKIELED